MSHITIVVIIVILIISFSGLFAFYFYKCFLQNVLQSREREPSSSPIHIVLAKPRTTDTPGLDPIVLNTFPICVYSAVKQYRKPKYGLECAICLLEFEDDHVLRLITICSHVFHQTCIDIWFGMHKTCPACRRNLELLAGEDTFAPDLCSEGTKAGDTKRDSVSITIKDDDHEERKGKFNGETGGSFTRSKTTGHSVFTARDSYEDRFILRLPDHVTEELVKSNHWPKRLYKSGSLGRKANIHGQGSYGNV